jgi:hypothetical protein
LDACLINLTALWIPASAVMGSIMGTPREQYSYPL